MNNNEAFAQARAEYEKCCRQVVYWQRKAAKVHAEMDRLREEIYEVGFTLKEVGPDMGNDKIARSLVSTTNQTAMPSSSELKP